MVSAGMINAKLAALHFYQLSLPPPKAPAGSYDKAAFERGKALLAGVAKCATCHVQRTAGLGTWFEGIEQRGAGRSEIRNAARRDR